MFKRLWKYVAATLFAGLGLMAAHAGLIPPAVFTHFAGITSGILSSAWAGTSLEGIPSPCPEAFVDLETEGPYYKTGSPERSDLIEAGIPGEVITLTGYVFGKDCNPIPGAWIDFWQADGSGAYDNQDYKLRGHQYTDKHGKYVLRTVIPGEYPGRTNHIHVKVRGHADGELITSQLYLPGSRLNTSDRIFSPSMLVTVTEGRAGEKIAFFSFKLNQ